MRNIFLIILWEFLIITMSAGQQMVETKQEDKGKDVFDPQSYYNPQSLESSQNNPKNRNKLLEILKQNLDEIKENKLRKIMKNLSFLDTQELFNLQNGNTPKETKKIQGIFQRKSFLNLRNISANARKTPSVTKGLKEAVNNLKSLKQIHKIPMESMESSRSFKQQTSKKSGDISMNLKNFQRTLNISTKSLRNLKRINKIQEIFKDKNAKIPRNLRNILKNFKDSKKISGSRLKLEGNFGIPMQMHETSKQHKGGNQASFNPKHISKNLRNSEAALGNQKKALDNFESSRQTREITNRYKDNISDSKDQNSLKPRNTSTSDGNSKSATTSLTKSSFNLKTPAEIKEISKDLKQNTQAGMNPNKFPRITRNLTKTLGSQKKALDISNIPKYIAEISKENKNSLSGSKVPISSNVRNTPTRANNFKITKDLKQIINISKDFKQNTQASSRQIREIFKEYKESSASPHPCMKEVLNPRNIPKNLEILKSMLGSQKKALDYYEISRQTPRHITEISKQNKNSLSGSKVQIFSNIGNTPTTANNSKITKDLKQIINISKDFKRNTQPSSRQIQEILKEYKETSASPHSCMKEVTNPRNIPKNLENLKSILASQKKALDYYEISRQTKMISNRDKDNVTDSKNQIPSNLRNSSTSCRNSKATSNITKNSLSNLKIKRQIRKISKEFKQNFEILSNPQNFAKNLRDSQPPLGNGVKITKNLQKQNETKLSKSLDFINQKTLTVYFQKPPKLLKILKDNFSLNRLKFLKTSLNIETIILYNYQASLIKFWPIFSHPQLPLLIITPNKFWELREKFNRNFLSIVFLKTDFSKQLEALKKSLNRRHLNKIIFITETFNSMKENGTLSSKYQELFNWLHLNGFWNSFLIDFQGYSLAYDHLTNKFIKNLSLIEFLKTHIKWSDLKGLSISCAMGSNPPRAYIQRDAENNVLLKGYYGTIVNLFTQHYNASLKPYILSDLDYYTELDCVKYISEGKVDICGDVLTYNPQYVITIPEEIAASYLMVPYDKPLPRFYYFLKPFQLHVWTIVTCSFFYKVITLAFIHRLQHGSWNAGLQILYAVLSVMFLPFHLTRVKGPYRKFLELIMILVGFVVANWYLSVLSSLLFTRLYSHDIKSLEDLARHNISIMVNEFEQYLLNSTENDPLIKQQLLVVSNDILLQNRRNLNPHYAYYSQYDKIEFYLHQQKFLLRPRLKVLSDAKPVNEVLAGIPMSPNWPLQHLLNGFIRLIMESGLYIRILDNAMEEGISTGYLHYFPTEHHYVEPLSIEYFQMPAMLLAVGYLLALMAFMGEILLYRKCKQK